MPMMAFMGVRNSWLMLARNWLLATLAASAASLGLHEGLLHLLALGNLGSKGLVGCGQFVGAFLLRDVDDCRAAESLLLPAVLGGDALHQRTRAGRP